MRLKAAASTALVVAWMATVLIVLSPQSHGVVEASDATKAYISITPTRVLDTRQPGQGGQFTHNEVRTLHVAGIYAVPLGAVAVAMNVTVTQPTGDGYVTVWPTGEPRPDTSNLNFVAGETVPNMMTIGVGTDGNISIFDYLNPEVGGLQVIVDVVGWYAAGFNPITPSRIMDTRVGLGGIKLAPMETRELLIKGAGNLPPFDIGAVAMNVTAVNPTGDGGYLTIWPTGHPRPNASSVNFQPGEIAANAVISGVGAGGTISISNYSGTTDVLVDVTGWFDVGYEALTPYRALDTRVPGEIALGPGETRTLTVIGVDNVPTMDVGAVALNVTATAPTQAGFLTIWPDGQPMPNASSLNFAAGQTIPNMVVTGVGSNGKIAIHNPFGSVHVIVDITGWFAQSDREAPILKSLSVSPTTIDTSLSAQVVTVTARITDDLAGNSNSNNPSQVRFESPSGGQFVFAVFGPAQLVAGTSLDGNYSFNVTVPRFSESGVWTIASFSLNDQNGNYQFYDAAQAASAGFSAAFTQTGPGDTSAPVLQTLSVSPASIDTSAAARVVTVTARITDDLAGNIACCNPSQVRFESPSGSQFVFAVFGPSQLVAGNSLDGTYSFSMTVPRFSESGTWTIANFSLTDEAHNYESFNSAQAAAAGFTATFHQTGPGDVTAPLLQSLSVSPAAINTSLSSQVVTVTARITDDLAGNIGCCNPSQVRFESPGGSQFVFAVFDSSHRVSGNSLDGIYTFKVTLPRFSQSGIWKIASLSLTDEAHNYRFYDATQAAAAGFTATFKVN